MKGKKDLEVVIELIPTTKTYHCVNDKGSLSGVCEITEGVSIRVSCIEHELFWALGSSHPIIEFLQELKCGRSLLSLLNQALLVIGDWKLDFVMWDKVTVQLPEGVRKEVYERGEDY
tara:strand:+ start:3620 stop:3970 length:351 start_codon:yes stop_codon:yes gene_type:complete